MCRCTAGIKSETDTRMCGVKIRTWRIKSASVKEALESEAAADINKRDALSWAIIRTADAI